MRSLITNLTFKVIQEKKTSPKLISTKVYGKENKVAYHQLRKRLFKELVDFIASERFNKEEEHVLEIKNLILTSKHLIENKNYKPILVTEDNELLIWGIVTFVVKAV
mgnify:CR=1 FL=1